MKTGKILYLNAGHFNMNSEQVTQSSNRLLELATEHGINVIAATDFDTSALNLYQVQGQKYSAIGPGRSTTSCILNVRDNGLHIVKQEWISFGDNIKCVEKRNGTNEERVAGSVMSVSIDKKSKTAVVVGYCNWKSVEGDRIRNFDAISAKIKSLRDQGYNVIFAGDSNLSGVPQFMGERTDFKLVPVTFLYLITAGFVNLSFNEVEYAFDKAEEYDNVYFITPSNKSGKVFQRSFTFSDLKQREGFKFDPRQLIVYAAKYIAAAPFFIDFFGVESPTEGSSISIKSAIPLTNTGVTDHVPIILDLTLPSNNFSVDEDWYK